MDFGHLQPIVHYIASKTIKTYLWSNDFALGSLGLGETSKKNMQSMLRVNLEECRREVILNHHLCDQFHLWSPQCQRWRVTVLLEHV